MRAATAAATAPPVSRTRSQAGTSAAFSAPSVNSRLTTLTSWNATSNASATGPAPSSAAIIESRANPSSREASVPVDTVRKERIMKALVPCFQRSEHIGITSEPHPESLTQNAANDDKVFETVIARSESDEAIHSFLLLHGLLRGACHRARIRATRRLAMTRNRLILLAAFQVIP